MPIVLLVAAASLFAAAGGSLTELVGQNPPPADEFDLRRVEFREGEIRMPARNPQREDITIALVTVDDAIVNFELDGPQTVERLRSSEIDRALRLGGGRADHGRGHELDRHPDDEGDPGGRRDSRGRCGAASPATH